MINGDLILGIDIGTTGAKCTFYTVDGTMAASAYQEYHTITPQNGWSEQDPEIWWKAVRENLQNCFSEQKIDSSKVLVVGLSCTNAVTIVDDDGMPLYNAISLHDKRATSQVAWLRQKIGEQQILDSCCNRLDKGTFCLPTLRWLCDNKPELIKNAKCFLMPSGYIIRKLTGEFTINESRMDLTLLADLRKQKWNMELCRLAEIPERLLPKVLFSTDIAGVVTPLAASLTGLKAGTPVTAGAVDTVAATIGAGAVASGDVAITLGSSGRICYVSDSPVADKRILNMRSVFADKYLLTQSMDNAGISLKWFRNVFGKAVQNEASAAGKDIYSYLDLIAEKAGPGAGGIVYLPYLTGEKSPIWNPDAKGVFFNVGINTDIGCFVRAILEGVAFSIRSCRDLVADGKSSSTCIPIGGGAAKSLLWCKIFADVLDCPVLQLPTSETETLGDMIIAAAAIGIKEVPFDFGKKIAAKGTVLYPNAKNVSLYSQRFGIFLQIYEKLKDCFF